MASVPPQIIHNVGDPDDTRQVWLDRGEFHRQQREHCEQQMRHGDKTWQACADLSYTAILIASKRAPDDKVKRTMLVDQYNAMWIRSL